jgi:ribonuclease HI
VAALVTRYATGTYKNEGPEICHEEQYALRTEVMDALVQHLPNLKDRFASPLNVHPQVTTYWSADVKDELFGAHHDAYSVQWTGCSIAHPPHTPEATSKAISWAVRSAQATDTPTLTIVTAYMANKRNQDGNNNPPDPYFQRWVDTYPHICRPILTLDAQKSKYIKPCPWNCTQKQISRAGPTCTLIVIGNKAGYLAYPQWQSLWKCFTSDPPVDKPLPSEGPQTPEENKNPLLKTHKKLRQLPSDQNLPQPTSNVREAEERIRLEYPHRFPPRWNWKQFAYTDGSVITDGQGPGIGAAVYLPEGNGTPNPEERSIPISLNESGERTINRAELAAIWVALKQGATRVATDSLGSIYQIQKMLNRPHDVKEHRHNNLLRSIVDLIQQSPEPIHLHKVKAHAGIVGNEKADAIAKAVAEGMLTEDLYTEVPQSNDRTGIHWPTYRPAPTQENPKPKRELIPSLDGHLKNVLHPQHRLGNANTETCYYSMWRAQGKNVMPKESNIFMTSKDITTKERRTALQYRSGQLYNNKLGKRWGHTTTDLCPLCGQADGGHHIASGCKRLYKAYTARHHQAGRIILKAILKGAHQADVAYSDLGAPPKLARDYIPKVDPRHQISLPKKSSKPDIILARKTANQRDPPARITLVEIKYCRDTDPTQQLEKARKQHAQLQQHLRETRKTEVDIIPVLLGTSGAIYNAWTKEALTKLGVEGEPRNRALKDLHFHAVRSLRSITSMRRKLERRRMRQGTPNPAVHTHDPALPAHPSALKARRAKTKQGPCMTLLHDPG